MKLHGVTSPYMEMATSTKAATMYRNVLIGKELNYLQLLAA